MQLHYCKYNMTISCKNPKRIFENWEISIYRKIAEYKFNIQNSISSNKEVELNILAVNLT